MTGDGTDFMPFLNQAFQIHLLTLIPIFCRHLQTSILLVLCKKNWFDSQMDLLLYSFCLNSGIANLLCTVSLQDTISCSL